ncbi:MAG: aminotransferase class V-fold PLP-dependent enzyme [Planctomycetota bacterium]
MESVSGPPRGASADWDAFRRQMPVTEKWAYFDHAAVAPLPDPARAAVARWAQDATENGDVSCPAWTRQLERLRALSAQLIGAELDEIALVRNTTEGINLVAEGFPWQPGDNCVTLADEFPSNQYPWMNLADRGVETRRVPADEGRVDLDRLAAACDARTRIVTVSWVSYSSGWRNDVDRLAEIAHRHGALLFLDAIQALGVFPLDVRQTPVDFLAADGHKWLLGPEGAGIFFTRGEHLDLLRPIGVGWNSVVHEHDFTRIELVLKDSARRYEGGSYNTAGMIGLCASMEVLAQFGPEAMADRIVQITDLACRRLTDFGAVVVSDRAEERKSGIVVFELPGRDPQAVRQRCLEQGVVLSCRAGRLRISPHAYNSAGDIDRLLEALE